MKNESISTPGQSELGKKSEYDSHYNPDKLFPISRKVKRDEIGVPDALPFHGLDLWNHYEVSWLNQKGKPIVALAEIIYDCETPNIIESKSMKLYFNSFNNYQFENESIVKQTIENDIAERVGGAVTVSLFALPLNDGAIQFANLSGTCLDNLDIECKTYEIDTSYLKTEENEIEEVLVSNLLKSNCLVTNQPDWGSVQITYKGKKINHEGLLKYIISFRNHNEFHEQCIERIFMDIMKHCQPEHLTVYGRYTRRGGLDINPLRSTSKVAIKDLNNARLYRQ